MLNKASHCEHIHQCDEIALPMQSHSHINIFIYRCVIKHETRVNFFTLEHSCGLLLPRFRGNRFIFHECWVWVSFFVHFFFKFIKLFRSFELCLFWRNVVCLVESRLYTIVVNPLYDNNTNKKVYYEFVHIGWPLTMHLAWLTMDSIFFKLSWFERNGWNQRISFML